MPRKSKSGISHADILAISRDVDRSSAELSEVYGISAEMVCRIRNGISWTDVTGLTRKARPKKHRAPLTASQVLEIYNDTTSSRQELAKRFGVTVGTVCAIKVGANRSDVTGHVYRPTPKVRLNPSDVKAIRASPERLVDIADLYGISTTNVYLIKDRRTWKRLL